MLYKKLKSNITTDMENISLSRVFLFILYHMVLLLCFITKYVIQEV